MAAKLILPGFGGTYTSAVITALTASTAGDDTFDLSRCARFAVALGAGQGSGTVQLQQTFNGGTTWSSFSTAITVASVGPTTLFEESDGPFGLMRFTTSLTAGTCQVTIVGVPDISN